MAAKMPIGMLIKDAIATVIRVPWIALPMPPPSSKPAGGNSVNKPAPMREPPFTINI